MKQNAAGLASICILSTMVLVMVSTTVSLYMGVRDEVESQYDGDAEIELYLNHVPDKDYRETILSEIKKSVKDSVLTKDDYEERENTTLSDIKKGQAAIIADPEYTNDTVSLLGREFEVTESRKINYDDAMFGKIAEG